MHERVRAHTRAAQWSKSETGSNYLFLIIVFIV